MKDANNDATGKAALDSYPFKDGFPADQSFPFEAMAPLLADLKRQLALRQAMA